MSKTVLLVGHCSPDSSYLTLAVRSVCPDATVERVNEDAVLRSKLEVGCDLLLINRVLEGNFRDHSGISLVATCRSIKPDVSVMLISNYPDAQASAIAAGAEPGFGKDDLGRPKALQALAAVLGVPSPA